MTPTWTEECLQQIVYELRAIRQALGVLALQVPEAAYTTFPGAQAASEIVREGQWLYFYERKVDVNNRVRNTLVGELHCSRILDLIAWLQQQEVKP